MPGNRIAVLRNVHITPNVRDVHERRIASDATVHNTWRLPKEQAHVRDVTRDENLMGIDQRGVDGVRVLVEAG
mgnify:CR=1 FL=1